VAINVSKYCLLILNILFSINDIIILYRNTNTNVAIILWYCQYSNAVMTVYSDIILSINAMCKCNIFYDINDTIYCLSIISNIQCNAKYNM